MQEKAPKEPSVSKVESRYIVMPQHANQYGTAFGGIIVSWIDVVASMSAQKHCATEAVTAGIDSISFKEPIFIGDHVVLKACVNYVGRTSMEVGVHIIKEDPVSGRKTEAMTAYLTFVALDKKKKPTPAGPLLPKTAEEKKNYENAKIRVQARKELFKKMR